MYLLFVVAIRTIAKGHQLVAEGWSNFEDAVGEMGMGELPQLLRSLRSSLTPTPTPTPTPGTPMKAEAEELMKVMEEGATPGTSISVTPVSQGGPESPITIQVKTEGGRVAYKYKCPQCEHIKSSKRGLDSHIRQVHTLKPFVCCLCDFTTYNLDSMQRHEKVHK